MWSEIKNKRDLAEVHKLELLKTSISEAITTSNNYPVSFEINSHQVEIKYTINEKLQSYILNLLESYKSDYGVVVVMDNESGQILAATGYSGKHRTVDNSLVFNSENPAASLFKIVTAASLLQTQKVTADTEVKVKGRGTTLYKYQLKEELGARTRKITLNKAFAMSNNVAFARLAIQNLQGGELSRSAENFYFNKEIMTDINLPASNYRIPSSQYNLAEIASGFNKTTNLTPIHAAFMASVVANNGKAVFPRLIKEMKVDDALWNIETIKNQQAIDPKVANAIKEMMISTTESGTARKSFRKLYRKIHDDIIIGGKTGSITGGEPEGKRDWFVSFAKENNSLDSGISMSIMLVNQKKWRVKSTYLATRIIDYYYREIKKIPKILTKNTPRKSVEGIL